MLLLYVALLITNQSPTSDPLVVYTYSSLKSGLSKPLTKEFSAISKKPLRWISFDDGYQMLNQLEINDQMKSPQPNLVLGIDQLSWNRAKKWADTKLSAPQIPWINQQWATEERGFIPFDYSRLGFLESSKSKTPPEESINFYLNDKWKKKIVFQDPRGSTPGFVFAHYLRSLDSKNYKNHLKKWKEQTLAVSPDWGSSYELFLSNSVSAVWTYETSLAYHRKDNKGDHYIFRRLKEGHPLQVEGAFILKNQTSESLKASQDLIKVLLSKEIQSILPETQWMLPVRNDIKMSRYFDGLISPPQNLTFISEKEIHSVLDPWTIQ